MSFEKKKWAKMRVDERLEVDPLSPGLASGRLHESPWNEHADDRIKFYRLSLSIVII